MAQHTARTNKSATRARKASKKHRFSFSNHIAAINHHNINTIRPCRAYIAYFKPWESAKHFQTNKYTVPPFVASSHYAVVSRFFIYKFLWFFYFSFFLFCLLPCVSVLSSICPLFRPTIARMSFCVQLVTWGNLKRLERKYEGSVYCVWIWYLFCAYFVVKC